MLLVYNILAGFSLVFILPYFFLRYKLGLFRKAAVGIKQRFGFYNIEKGNYIVLLASSVGELKTVTKFIVKLKREFPQKKILILTMTPYGYHYVRDKNIVDNVLFAPIDIPFCVEKLFLKATPEMLILVESEFWPNLIFSAKRKGAKIILINGRMSDKSFKRYLFVKEFMAEILKKIDFICAREESDKKKFIALGFNEQKIIKTGNMKYDKMEDKEQKIIKTKIDYGFSKDDLIFVAGSTREKEEEIIIKVYKKLIAEFNNLKLVIAPRYPDRCGVIEKLFQREDIVFIRKSQMEDKGGQNTNYQCLLLDTIGDLTNIYSFGTVIFVGGSLFEGAGGHNMLEPAELGKTVIFGKYVKNFQESAEGLIINKAAFQIKDEYELYDVASKLLGNQVLSDEMGKKAREVVISQRGATDKNLKIISEMIINA
ncbi:MAG: hypothetical protein A2474_08370 [Elusimicrobia bacterium RIFOXYC2_FULL_34_12]|nr:MAG: hypothetical protein A2474_08370 [Elusimicrobia bacterium RIFOXYC2_FULL_34_12]OGS39670.1 MAG: hypothetical protein A2551_07465 [Elusimicrobia bacterium RIFOXYD2_FULL_34_30]HAM38602.1 hypothetical protein [Elusimicrobiota bacterium]